MTEIQKRFVRWFLKHEKWRKYQWLTILITGSISLFGFEFDYHGDYIWYSYPWICKRYNHVGRPWVSTGCEGNFATLKELDQFWEDYFNAC